MFTINQGCSGIGTQWSSVQADIFEPERCSGKYCLSQAANQLVPLVSYLARNMINWFSGKSLKSLPQGVRF